MSWTTFVKQSRRGWYIGRPVSSETTKSISQGMKEGGVATPRTLPFVFDKFNERDSVAIDRACFCLEPAGSPPINHR